MRLLVVLLGLRELVLEVLLVRRRLVRLRRRLVLRRLQGPSPVTLYALGRRGQCPGQ